jgi:hypothetical protein
MDGEVAAADVEAEILNQCIGDEETEEAGENIMNGDSESTDSHGDDHEDDHGLSGDDRDGPPGDDGGAAKESGEDPALGEEEVAPPKVATQPRLPDRGEVDLHEAMGHARFRNWCEACVFGQGREDLHLRGGGWRSLPVVSYDYAYLGDKNAKESKKGTQVGTKLLIGKDSKSKALFAHAIAQKGIHHADWNFQRVNNDLQKLGYRRLILKND